eukprot:6973587-Pyramimonas_sp.AAC.1
MSPLQCSTARRSPPVHFQPSDPDSSPCQRVVFAMFVILSALRPPPSRPLLGRPLASTSTA